MMNTKALLEQLLKAGSDVIQKKRRALRALNLRIYPLSVVYCQVLVAGLCQAAL